MPPKTLILAVLIRPILVASLNYAPIIVPSNYGNSDNDDFLTMKFHLSCLGLIHLMEMVIQLEGVWPRYFTLRSMFFLNLVSALYLMMNGSLQVELSSLFRCIYTRTYVY